MKFLNTAIIIIIIHPYWYLITKLCSLTNKHSKPGVSFLILENEEIKTFNLME